MVSVLALSGLETWIGLHITHSPLVEFCLIGQALQCARTYCLRCYACTRMYDQQIYACARTYMVHCAMLLLELMVSSIMVRSCI